MNEGSTPSVPDAVTALAASRAALRAARDFAGADAARDEIRALGYDVIDGPDGWTLAPLETPQAEGPAALDPRAVPSLLGSPAIADVSLQWVVEGWPEDTIRAIEAFRATSGDAALNEVVVDLVGSDPAIYPSGVDVVSLAPDSGWAVARNVGIERAVGTVVVVLDGSIEPTGDAIAPLIEALGSPKIGVAGPFGISTEDLRSFEESTGPSVDAIEGYCLAFRRELAVDGLRFDPWFRFYRTADIDLCFRVAELGLDRVVVPLPVVRHEHRMWHSTSEEERARLSKRNFYRFLEHFRGRTDLTVKGAQEASGSGPNVGGL